MRSFIVFLLLFFSFYKLYTQELREFSINESDIELISSTYLGNIQRNYYGNKAPENLKVKWKIHLGHGLSSNPRKGKRYKKWSGAGWTGQAATFREDSNYYLIQPSFSHNLYRINAENGEIKWKYKFDDILKGSPTIWKNHYCWDTNRYMIFQGSRRGINTPLYSGKAYSLRAINLSYGDPLWYYNVEKTRSYSRDVDASPLVVNDTLYAPLENGYLLIGDPRPGCINKAEKPTPAIFDTIKTYAVKDAKDKRTNVVIEASPTYFNDHIYMSSGSGWVYGFNIITDSIDWCFHTGGDMDGSPVVTNDSCILVTVEKQYIPGKGGVFKLDPEKEPENCIEWFLPVDDKDFAFWNGGILGSAAVNDSYIKKNDQHLAAIVSLSGDLYVINHEYTTTDSVLGPDNKTKYLKPEVVFKYHIGPTLSTPVFTDSKLMAAGYEGAFLFSYDKKCLFTLEDKFEGNFESTPVFLNGNAFIASRNGYLYCLGKNSEPAEK